MPLAWFGGWPGAEAVGAGAPGSGLLQPASKAIDQPRHSSSARPHATRSLHRLCWSCGGGTARNMLAMYCGKVPREGAAPGPILIADDIADDIADVDIQA